MGMRILGKVAGSLIGQTVSMVSEGLESQRAQMEDLLQDASRLLSMDRNARQYLCGGDYDGDQLQQPIEVGRPFSQSSSTVSVNGRTRTNLQASFEVYGSRGSGVAIMDATEDGIQSLRLNVNGRVLDIDLDLGRRGSSSFTSDYDVDDGGSSSRLGKNRNIKDNVIDAEFVDKKYDK